MPCLIDHRDLSCITGCASKSGFGPLMLVVVLLHPCRQLLGLNASLLMQDRFKGISNSLGKGILARIQAMQGDQRIAMRHEEGLAGMARGMAAAGQEQKGSGSGVHMPSPVGM